MYILHIELKIDRLMQMLPAAGVLTFYNAADACQTKDGLGEENCSYLYPKWG